MKPTAIICGTAMLICYAVLGVMDQPTWFLLPLVLSGIVTLLIGLGDGKGAQR